jgi:hypothetical protein
VNDYELIYNAGNWFFVAQDGQQRGPFSSKGEAIHAAFVAHSQGQQQMASCINLQIIEDPWVN